MNVTPTSASSEMIGDVVPHSKVKVFEAHTTVAISVKFTAWQIKHCVRQDTNKHSILLSTTVMWRF